jgi:hypothetical protein
MIPEQCAAANSSSSEVSNTSVNTQELVQGGAFAN